jgi:hypothetical protein
MDRHSLLPYRLSRIIAVCGLLFFTSLLTASVGSGLMQSPLLWRSYKAGTSLFVPHGMA